MHQTKSAVQFNQGDVCVQLTLRVSRERLVAKNIEAIKSLFCLWTGRSARRLLHARRS